MQPCQKGPLIRVTPILTQSGTLPGFVPVTSRTCSSST